MSKAIDRTIDFLTKRYQEITVAGIWLISLEPGLIVSLHKGDPFYASLIVMVIQFMASFGSITLFGVIAQLLCYYYVESVDVHEKMMDGLFYGFHAGMIIWIFYAFYNILFGRKIIGEINVLIGFFGIMCILSCIFGLLTGFIIGKCKQSAYKGLLG